MREDFYIKGPRQLRALLTLLEKPRAVSDLGLLIGALNPRQIISELRNQGFYGIIITRRYTIIDQDGKRCRPGEYYIPDKFKPIVKKAIKEQIAKSPAKLLGNSVKTSANNTNRRTL